MLNNFRFKIAPPYTGFFIVFEGLDGSGKTTQCEYLKQALDAKGHETILTREPTEGPWGQKIRKAFKTRKISAKEELDLFIRDRKDHIEDLILPSLKNGKIVIQDRYFLSTAAYQGSRGLDSYQIIKDHESFAPLPNATCFIDIEPEMSIRRITEGRKEVPNAFEQIDGLKKCKQIFDQIVLPGLVRFNGSLKQENLHNSILHHILKYLPKKRR